MREIGLQKGGAAGSSPIRVLVVDDSHVIRGLLSRSLDSDPGIKVVATASNGKAAIDEVTRTEVDVVVLRDGKRVTFSVTLRERPDDL